MRKPGKEMDAPLLRPWLYSTRAVRGASLVKNTSQRGRLIELTGQFPSGEGSLGLQWGQGSWPFGFLPI